MAQLTGKLMEQKLKYGWTLADVAKYLNCSEEEVEEKIRKEFSSKAAHSMLVRMEKNAKQRERKLTSRGKSASRTAKRVSSTNVQQHVELSEEELLKQKEETIIKSILDAEAMFKDALANKNSYKKQLANEQTELIKIQQQVNAKKEKVNDIISKIFNADSEMSNANAKLGDLRKELETVKSELRELNKLTIFVYANGIIEAEDYNLDEIDFQKKYDDITANRSDIVDDLTLKQIKQLAKLLVFTASIVDRAYEIIFDSEDLQMAFNVLNS